MLHHGDCLCISPKRHALYVILPISIPIPALFHSLHSHDFLRTCRMNSNTGVEIALSSAHLHSYCKALQHLSSPQTYQVQPHNFFFWSLAHNLEFSWIFLRLVRRENIVHHGCELRMVYFNIFFAVSGNGLRFSKSDRSDLWVGEDYCRYIAIREERPREM